MMSAEDEEIELRELDDEDYVKDDEFLTPSAAVKKDEPIQEETKQD